MLPLTTILILSIVVIFIFFCLQFILAALHENYTPSKRKYSKNTALQILKTKILYKIKNSHLLFWQRASKFAVYMHCFCSKPKRILKDRAKDFMEFGTEQYSADTCPIPLRHDLSHSHTTHKY